GRLWWIASPLRLCLYSYSNGAYHSGHSRIGHGDLHDCAGFPGTTSDRWCPIAQGNIVAHDMEEGRIDLWHAHGAGHAVVLLAHRHRRFLDAEIRRVSRFGVRVRHWVLGRGGDPTDLAERCAAPSRARAIHDGCVLHPLCDRNDHLHDALSLIPRQDW